MPDVSRPKVFISYASTDRAPVERLARKLEAEGLEVWMDRNIHPGQDWQGEIEKALDEASIFLFVLSPNSKQSTWQQVELGMALRSAVGQLKRVIPVLLEGTDQATVPGFLRHERTVEFDSQHEDRAVQSIAQAAMTALG